MNKDHRYEVVKDMIETGRITEFKHIFKYIPKTVLAHDLNTNTTRITRMIDNVELFTLDEMRTIGALVQVSYHTIIGLATTQMDRSA